MHGQLGKLLDCNAQNTLSFKYSEILVIVGNTFQQESCVWYWNSVYIPKANSAL